jgi:hypothetical protein
MHSDNSESRDELIEKLEQGHTEKAKIITRMSVEEEAWREVINAMNDQMATLVACAATTEKISWDTMISLCVENAAS